MQILQCKNVLNIGYINHKKKNLFQNKLRLYTLHGFSNLVHFSWTSIPLMVLLKPDVSMVVCVDYELCRWAMEGCMVGGLGKGHGWGLGRGHKMGLG